MRLKDILVRKGHHVQVIEEHRSVLEAAKTLVHHNIGSLLVQRGGRVTGIVTERDVLRIASERGPLEDIAVGSIMSNDLVVADPEDELYAAMGVMTERRIRHLPVMEGGVVVGIVSIGDLVNACRVVAEDENSQLRHYIHTAW